MYISGQITRFCSHCEKILSIEDFVKCYNRPYGRGYICYICLKEKNKLYKEYRRKYYLKIRNTPKYKKGQKESDIKYRQTKKGKLKRKEYRNKKEIKEKDKIYAKKYYKENKEKRLKRAVAWVKNNPEKNKINQKRANKKRRTNPLTCFTDRIRHSLRKQLFRIHRSKPSKTFEILGYSQDDLKNKLIKYLQLPCEVCKKKLVIIKNSHIDHIEPTIKGKTFEEIVYLNRLDNLRLICSECNQRKWAYE